MKINVKIKLIEHEGVDTDILPLYMTPGSAGFDLCAAIPAPVTICAGQRVMIPTGISLSINAEYAGFVFARSGLASKYGINLANGVGVVDSDYTGEVTVPLYNSSDVPYTVNPGDRVAQMVFLQAAQAHFLFVSDLPKTKRGDGGFGSTGRG